ncbi:hypothetical protein TSOC_007472 [Tetrabaena socialis]|uniref:Uncharacterized protein n=1 Tax=Tetrabaena socialis TaxID=47790 RepID=A0A2J8A102_9CHLO|nr:hypothetical protein TSOC_007472 [Tetrabaena socialis]|eukprot:PNH06199.1 hypothetical protein TSOC_007472 [Tetrabaena socialis]
MCRSGGAIRLILRRARGPLLLRSLQQSGRGGVAASDAATCQLRSFFSKSAAWRRKRLVGGCTNDLLYTFNAQCPEDKWPEEATQLLAAAASFQLS